MAHSRTARKAVRQNEKRRIHNKAALSTMRTQIKKVETAIRDQDAKTAAEALPRAQKLLDKSAKTHRIHANKAARVKARLTRAVNRLAAK